MEQIHKTVYYDRHVSLGAKMVEFGGWEMPLHYKTGIVREHLITRKHSGLFDISHMGRFRISGSQALPFLQYTLSNNAAALRAGQSQYTIIPNDHGAAIDDAYLYRIQEDEFLLVVNAANRLTDWNYLTASAEKYDQVNMSDLTHEQTMLSLQGPLSREILQKIITSGPLPKPIRNHLSISRIEDTEVLIAGTGYTGEPIGFELFVRRKDSLMIWNLLVGQGAQPIGLGARDTLRLEAGLPLYGHELGLDPEGMEIPIFSMGLSRFAVSLSPLKGDFVGRIPLEKQFRALKKIIHRDYGSIADLPRMIRSVALKEKGIARSGNKVFQNTRHVGYITSGTMVPYWRQKGDGIASRPTDENDMRAIGLAMLDSGLGEGDEIDIDIRGKKTTAVIVPYHLKCDAPPYARPVIYHKN
jgi:aminomethyltransferase